MLKSIPQSSKPRGKVECSQARHKTFNLKALKHKYVAKMPGGYLNHPLPVSVLSLCFGEEPKMFHSFWHRSLHLKRVYTSGALTPRGKKKKNTYFGCQDLNVLTLSNETTPFYSQWDRSTTVTKRENRLSHTDFLRKHKKSPSKK